MDGTMPGTRRDWVDVMGTLPDGAADEVAAATRAAARLAGLARTLVDSALVPSACGRPDDCRLAGVLPQLCDVARALATSPSARALRPATTPDADAAIGAFVDALVVAGSAIYVCRRMLHPTGRCLFAGGDPARIDVCAGVLIAAHRLGGVRASTDASAIGR